MLRQDFKFSAHVYHQYRAHQICLFCSADSLCFTWVACTNWLSAYSSFQIWLIILMCSQIDSVLPPPIQLLSGDQELTILAEESGFVSESPAQS